jgi:uncharacterized membrane protein
MSKVGKLFFALGVLVLFVPSFVFAKDSSERIKGRVVEVNGVSCDEEYSNEEYRCVEYVVDSLDGKESFQTSQSVYSDEKELFKLKSKVYVTESEDLDGNVEWQIDGYSREFGLFLLISVFIVISFLINGKQGFGATLGLLSTVVILYAFTIPMIIKGGNTFLIASLTVVMLLLSSYLSHGFNKKTTIALGSMSIGTVIIFVLGFLILKALHVTGIGEEISKMLTYQLAGSLDLFDLLLFGIVLGGVGVLDDVAIGQVSAMQEILKSNTNLTASELYSKSMNIGKDHIASMINTLFIAYAGSSLSLVIILALNNPDFSVLVNLDFITEEIIRTVVPSIGLILIVPLTTFLASHFLTQDISK